VSPREIGQSVIDGRIALGLTARSQRPPPAPGPAVSNEVLMRPVVIVKPEE
jgi:hypothetical protein